MKNVIDFPDRVTVEHEAAGWLVRLDGDEPLGADELRRLQAWMSRSPAHRSELVELARLWNKINLLTELAVPLGSVRRDGRLRSVKLRYGLAAVTMVIAFLAAMSLFLPSPAPEGTPANGLYTTAVGEQRAVTLSDGSRVMLNTDTALRVNYGERFRDVVLLQGEAHFTVVPEDTLPFRVFAGAGQIRAVGTAFSVYLRDGGVDVTVTQGTVAVAHRDLQQGGRPASTAAGGEAAELGTLTAGQAATIGSGRSSGATPAALTNVRQVSEPDMSRRMAWTDGMLMFSGESLEYAVREISRYTTMRIRIPDPQVRAIRIGGRFPVGETDQMLDALEKNFGLRVTRLSDTEVLVSAGTELHDGS